MAFKQVVKYGLLTIMKSVNGQNNANYTLSAKDYDIRSVQSYSIDDYNEAFNYAKKDLKYSINAQDSLDSYKHMETASQNIPQKTKSEENSSSMTWMYIQFGGALIAACISVLGLCLWGKRRN